MNNGSPLISIKEARKLLDKEKSELLTDDLIEDMINDLDFLAGLFIENYNKKEK